MSTMVRTGVTFVLGTMFGSFITRVAVAKRGHHHKAGPNCPRENLGKKTTASPGAAEEAIKTIPNN
jgi:hypothetical protein